MIDPDNGKHRCVCRIDCGKVVQFYDHEARVDPLEEDNTSAVSAITGVIGEDLVLGLLLQYLESQGEPFEFLSYKCSAQERPFHRLDAWVITHKMAYQVEVKNWGAAALGGEPVADDDSDLWEVATYNHKTYLERPRTPSAVWKVLRRMRSTEGVGPRPVMPLLAFWSPVAPPGGKREETPLFFRDVAIYKLHEFEVDGGFEKFGVFSASLYLRALECETIDLWMPRAARRIRQLKRMLTVL